MAITRSPLLTIGCAALFALAMPLSACGGQTHPASASTTSSPTAPSAPPSGAPSTLSYQLHMDFFSHESNQPAVIDPQMFVSSPGTPAGTGPQNISHAADVTPAPKTDPPETTLLAADGTPLGITLGQWESAAGTVSMTCDGSQETAAHELRGLIPGGLYSVFVVHLNIQGSGRFTPFGDPAGTTNNFTASADETASPTTTVRGCLTNQEAVVIIWHSDHQAHGASAGTIGVDWHNALITRVT